MSLQECSCSPPLPGRTLWCGVCRRAAACGRTSRRKVTRRRNARRFEADANMPAFDVATTQSEGPNRDLIHRKCGFEPPIVGRPRGIRERPHHGRNHIILQDLCLRAHNQAPQRKALIWFGTAAMRVGSPKRGPAERRVRKFPPSGASTKRWAVQNALAAEVLARAGTRWPHGQKVATIGRSSSASPAPRTKAQSATGAICENHDHLLHAVKLPPASRRSGGGDSGGVRRGSPAHRRRRRRF